MKKAILLLEDGTCFNGISAGADGETYGEIVFNTSMMGYQEILTDPSYRGQIVTMTYPEIGNYGVNADDIESGDVQVEGFVMKEISKISSNWRCDMTLQDYLKKYKIVAVEGIDTRELTRHIRDFGAMRSVLSTTDSDKKSLLKKVKASQSIVGIDLAKEVSTKKPYNWTEKLKPVGMMKCECDYVHVGKNSKSYKVVAYDCGIKHNILRILADLNCNVTVVPITATAEEVLAYKPDGIFISNGP
ncbi:MAG: carbamoyl phosphate synthase small subunit, partial [Spirochaetia bacterium]|nr:carbamoyl phosphate synthase small subunit [Spirochaetia bacterium]